MGPEKRGLAGWTVLALDPDGPASLRFKMFLSSRHPEWAGRGPERPGGSGSSSLRLPQAHLYGSSIASRPGWASRGWTRWWGGERVVGSTPRPGLTATICVTGGTAFSSFCLSVLTCLGSARSKGVSKHSRFVGFFLFVFAVHGPLTAVASPVAEHRLRMRRLSGHGSRAQLLRGMWDLPGPGHCATREALSLTFNQ